MKTKREVAMNNSIRQICVMQEEFMSNKCLDIDSRINVVKYLEQVKDNINKVLSDNVETEIVSNN